MTKQFPLLIGEHVFAKYEFDQMPPGTVIMSTDNSHIQFTLGEDGVTWNPTGRNARHDRSFTSRYLGLQGQYKVASYPEGFEMPMNVKRYAAMIRQGMVWNTEYNGVSMATVQSQLAAIQAGPDDFPFVTGMRLCGNYDRDRLPHGSVVAVGDPSNFETFGLFQYNEQTGRWNHILGRNSQIQPAVWVVQVGGQEVEPDWITAPAEPDLAGQIALFKAKTWTAGIRAKSEQQWCSTLESILRRYDITATCARNVPVDGFMVGQTVDALGASLTPEGTLLTHSTEAGGWAWFKRDTERGRNTARTIRIASGGGLIVGNYARRNLVIQYLPIDGVGTGFTFTNEQFAELPPGAMFTYAGTTAHWVKGEDGRLVQIGRDQLHIPRTGVHQLDAFGQQRDSMLYVGIVNGERL